MMVRTTDKGGTTMPDSDLASDISKAEERTALSAAISALKPIVEASYRQQAEAKRRLWVARDRVAALKAQLADAKVSLDAAERDYDEASEWMRLTWGDFREHVERIPVADGTDDA